MSEFKIRIKDAENARQILGSSSVKINKLRFEIRNVKRNIRWEVQNRDDIDYRISSLIEDIDANYSRLIKRGSILQQAIDEYISTENGLIGYNGLDDFVRSTLIEMLKTVGPFEKAADMVMNTWCLATGASEFDSDYISTMATDLLGIVGSVYPVIKSNPGWVKTLCSPVADFVADSADDVIEASTEDLIEEFVIKNASESYISKSAGAVCNWLTAIVGSGIKNAEEMQIEGYGFLRYLEETIGEAGLAVAENILVTSAIGAAAIAVGVTAPGWVIGAAAAGAIIVIDTGLNGIVNFATDGAETDWKDAVVDIFIDYHDDPIAGMNAVLSAGENFLSKTCDNVMDLKETVCEWGIAQFA
ncbi:hypothetical protein [Oribacterium sp. FC2011]|uniref:hypothetical protein n=1 Tax=Oribacterium sp. FC2011 TaxID=1408311 RepID=UPI0004E0DE45|nr:hypothetical protein [Oribacterium sp. FC2011]